MDQVVSSLISFLTCIVHRHGGMLTIENLSDFSNRDFELRMELDPKHDSVTLIVVDKEAKGEMP